MSAERNFQKLRLGVVTPMANEAETAIKFVRQVLDNTSSIPQTTLFVVLDKVSKDETRALLEDYAAHEPQLHVVWLRRTNAWLMPMCEVIVKPYPTVAIGYWKSTRDSATLLTRFRRSSIA